MNSYEKFCYNSWRNFDSVRRIKKKEFPMTRINLIDPVLLCNQHLMAEYRELIRIPNSIVSGRMKSKYADQPKSYVLGSGHVKFFVDKMKWLHDRHRLLYAELRHREFNVQEILWDGIVDDLVEKKIWNDWSPSNSEIELNISRILVRMPENAKWTNRKIEDVLAISA